MIRRLKRLTLGDIMGNSVLVDDGVSLEYFFQVRELVETARNEVLEDGQRNPTLELVYNLVFNN